MSMTDKTLAEHLRIAGPEIQARKQLLGLTPRGEAALGRFRPTMAAMVEGIVAEFYDHQLDIAEISAIISDADTLKRLRSAMHGYVLQLFDGEYGMDYVNTRLRIGKVHARIGVSPKLYVASLHKLEMILRHHASRHGATPELLDALHTLFLFDLQLVFDTYIQGLMSQVESAHTQLQSYASTLEAQVAERTAEIARVARTDPLTGLDNRREFFRLLSTYAAHAFAHQEPLSLCFFDADDFKAINDRFGHLHGDKVLAQIAALLRDRFAETGHVFRYGGDEFCVLVPRASEATVGATCEAVCHDLRGVAALSFGVAGLEPDDRDNIEQLIARADARMYAQKATLPILSREI